MSNRLYRVLYAIYIKMRYHNKIILNGFPKLGYRTKFIVTKNGIITLGKSVSTFSNVALSSVGGKLDIGDGVTFNRNCIIVCRSNITIREKCMFGPNVCIYDHNHKYGYEGISNDYNVKPIVIERNCWIGANAVILKGTHIGEGCVIGAGTIVCGRIPPHSIVTNNREMIIRTIKGEKKENDSDEN